MNTAAETEALVIRTYPAGEADIVLRVLTSGGAKLSLIAKHARKSSRRFAGSLEIFDRGNFKLRQGPGSLTLIDSYNLSYGSKKLRENLDRMCAGSFICEAYDLLIKDEMTEMPQLYETIILALRALEESTAPNEILKICYLTSNELLATLGYEDKSKLPPPSSRGLERTFRSIEQHAHRELSTKGELIRMISRLG